MEGSPTFLERVCSFKKVAGGAEGGSFSAHPAMGVSVCSNPDMEFLCPNCPVDARTWPNRAALRSHMMSMRGWRNPWRQYVCGILLPCLLHPVPLTSQRSCPFGSSCGALQAGNTGGSRPLPKTGACGAGKAGPTGSAGAQKGIKTWSLLDGGLLAGRTKRASKRTLNTEVKLRVALGVSPPPCTRKSASVFFLLPYPSAAC